MVEQAEAEVRIFTWLMRGGGWLLLSFGMITVLKPLSVVGDVIPFIGNLLAGGITIFAFITCAIVALFTIAIAWIATRPLVGIPVLLAAVGLILFQWSRARATT
jgi:polyferredoxin